GVAAGDTGDDGDRGELHPNPRAATKTATGAAMAALPRRVMTSLRIPPSWACDVNGARRYACATGNSTANLLKSWTLGHFGLRKEHALPGGDAAACELTRIDRSAAVMRLGKAAVTATAASTPVTRRKVRRMVYVLSSMSDQLRPAARCNDARYVV